MDPLTPERLAEIREEYEAYASNPANRKDDGWDSIQIVMELLSAYDALLREKQALENVNNAALIVDWKAAVVQAKEQLATAEVLATELRQGLTVKEQMLTDEHTELEQMQRFVEAWDELQAHYTTFKTKGWKADIREFWAVNDALLKKVEVARQALTGQKE